ncbi:MAG: hypothetical protein IJY12_00565, partial [Clostridia bacterium]|nr:hypothetical protein [Clostridia bacterium]
MKRLIPVLLIFSLILSLCACSGNYAKIDLKKPVEIPEDGVIEKGLLEKIKDENAIATFTGESGGIKYEWTLFGSDISEVREVNLLISLERTEDGVEVIFGDTEDFGFPALLSIRLNEKWKAQGATAYKDDAAVFSVSITGSKTSILNISVSRAVGECVIRPNEIKDTSGDTNRPNSDGSAIDQDKYLTDPGPEGKPLPVEPENQEINKGKAYTCTFSIECSTILNNLENLDPDKLELVPSDGVILPPTTVTFYEGESVFDVIQRVCKEYNIHLEFSFTPIY